MEPGTPETLTLPYRWAGVEGAVAVELGVNDDPAAFGCAEFARGFPYCRARVEPPAKGYAEALGWVQLIEQSIEVEGFQIDTFEPLGEVSHPFGFFGFGPTMFDAPHRDDRPDLDWTAHSFLCGLGGRLLDFHEKNTHEARAVLGFSWGFSIRDGQIEIEGLNALGFEAWDGHIPYLTAKHPAWSFAAGFHETARDG